MTESSAEVRTWQHSRKGPITGFVTWEDDEWMDIQIVGEQKLNYASISNRLAGPHPDGDTVRVRKSLVFEVTA